MGVCFATPSLIVSMMPVFFLSCLDKQNTCVSTSPYVCLLFHECLKTGSFDVQGVNSCREHFNNSAFLTNGLLDLQERNGMNATSFGCDRPNINCQFAGGYLGD